MKKLTFILMAVFLLFAVISCIFNGDEEETKYPARTFWARNFKTDSYYLVNAEKLAEGKRCVVWAEQGSGVTETTAKNMADEYDNKIYVNMMKVFGWEVDSEDLYYLFDVAGLPKMNTMEFAHYFATNETSNAKLTILLLDIKDNYSPTNRGFTAGYFDSRNLFEYPNSNKLDMIYVDINPGVPGSRASSSTFAHEMQHLMNVMSSIVYRLTYDEDTEELEIGVMDTWVDEGLSLAAEWVYDNGDPNNRVGWFNSNGGGNGKINEGNNFFVWDNHSENASAILDDYATVYLFFRYLRLQAGAPNDIYFDILTSEFSDYFAVTTAESINSAHKNNWKTLLRDWFAANYTNNSSGLYGYKGELILKAPMYKAVTTVALYPGEGVYSKINGSDSVPSSSGNISYAGLNSTGAPVTSGSASGARLTYNINTNNKGAAASGNTTGVASIVDISAPAGNASLQIASVDFSRPYVVDGGYFLRKNQNYGISDNVRRSVSSINSDGQTGKSNIPKFDRSKLKVKRVVIDE